MTAELKNGRLVREALQKAYRRAGVDEEAAHDFMLAVSEAFSNAICHGSSRPGDAIEVRLSVGTEGALVSLKYRGEPFAAGTPRLPDDGSTNGRGRYLIQILADRVEYEFNQGWTRAELCKQWS